MPTVRCFIALALPDAVRAALVALVEPLAGVKWTPPGSLHLTMRFLGELCSSELRPAGAVHTLVRRFPLAK